MDYLAKVVFGARGVLWRLGHEAPVVEGDDQQQRSGDEEDGGPGHDDALVGNVLGAFGQAVEFD